MCNCPTCNGESVKVGNLGNLVWFRCRYCGMTFNVPINSPELEMNIAEDEGD